MRLFFYSLDIILISFLFVSNPVVVDGRPVGPSGLSNAQTSETFMGYIVAQNFVRSRFFAIPFLLVETLTCRTWPLEGYEERSLVTG